MEPYRNCIKALLALCMTCGLAMSGMAAADTQTLWQLVDPAQHQPVLSGIRLPASLATRQAVQLDPEVLRGLEQGDRLVVATAPGREVEYPLLEDAQRFVNGDRGWRGGFSVGASVYSLSLTLNAELVLATVYAPSGQYELQALRDGDGYTGWLYSLVSTLPSMPFDNGSRHPERVTRTPVHDARLALQGPPSTTQPGKHPAVEDGDVTVEQRFAPEFAKRGETVATNVRIVNNRAEAIQALPFAIQLGPRPEFATLAGAVSGCADDGGASSEDFDFECVLPDIPARGELTVTYSVLIGEEAWPFVRNRIVLGAERMLRDEAFIFLIRDTLVDSDQDGISDFNEEIIATDPNDAASPADADVTPEIDLLFLYTPRFLQDLSYPFAETEINHLVQNTNAWYAASGARVRFRPVYYGFVDYRPASLNNAYDQLSTLGHPALASVGSLRRSVGADVTVLIDGLLTRNDNVCGLATGPGVRLEGDLFPPWQSPFELLTVVYKPGFPGPGLPGCDPETLAHELGHNLGLAHSRRDTGARGTFEWSRGHGVERSFSTIMASSSRWNTTTNLLLFSNPANRTGCNGMPCGVARNSPDSADAVHSINVTRFQIAAQREPRVLNVATLNGADSSLIMFGAATHSPGRVLRASRFRPEDAIDVRATLAIPTAHQSESGRAYVVIDAGELGLYFRDAQGGYQSWNGALETLGSAIGTRPLNVTEELIAFDGLVPASVNVNAAEITVYFGYSVEGTDVFAYSAEGISFSIGP